MFHSRLKQYFLFHVYPYHVGPSIYVATVYLPRFSLFLIASLTSNHTHIYSIIELLLFNYLAGAVVQSTKYSKHVINQSMHVSVLTAKWYN